MVAITDGSYYDVFRGYGYRKSGHIQVRHQDYLKTRALYDTVNNSDQIVEDIQKMPEKLGLTERLYASALVEFNDNGAGTQIVGILPETENLYPRFISR